MAQFCLPLKETSDQCCVFYPTIHLPICTSSSLSQPSLWSKLLIGVRFHENEGLMRCFLYSLRGRDELKGEG